MNTRIALFAAALALSGCASLSQFSQRHPVATAVGLTVIAGSIAATANANSHGSHTQDCGTGLPHGCAPVGASPP